MGDGLLVSVWILRAFSVFVSEMWERMISTKQKHHEPHFLQTSSKECRLFFS
jgi:hypothetical protein